MESPPGKLRIHTGPRARSAAFQPAISGKMKRNDASSFASLGRLPGLLSYC